jgi:type VI protein secretion system component VasA
MSRDGNWLRRPGQDAGQGRRITVEVQPGGALSSLALTERALSLGGTALAAAILDAVAEATALANQRVRHALRTAVAEPELVALGLISDAALVERVECTTPDTWRV